MVFQFVLVRRRQQKPDLARRPGKVLERDFIDEIHGPVACMVSQRHSMGIQVPGTCPTAHSQDVIVLTKTFCSGEASVACSFRGAMLDLMESHLR